MDKRITKIKIKNFYTETAEMSFADIGRYIMFLLKFAEKNKISKSELYSVYGEWLPSYIDKKLLRLDAENFTIKNIKSIDTKSK